MITATRILCEQIHTNRNRELYNGEIDNRARTVTMLSPETTHPNLTNRFQHKLHSMSRTTNPYSHFTNCMYQGTQKRSHTYHTAPFSLSNTAGEQQGFHHRGSPR